MSRKGFPNLFMVLGKDKMPIPIFAKTLEEAKEVAKERGYDPKTVIDPVEATKHDPKTKLKPKKSFRAKKV